MEQIKCSKYITDRIPGKSFRSGNLFPFHLIDLTKKCSVCPIYNVRIIETLKHKFNSTDANEKVTVFVRCITDEKLEYINLFGPKKSSENFIKLSGIPIILGMRKVFENNCTYVTLDCSKSVKASSGGEIKIPAGALVGRAQKVQRSQCLALPDVELGNKAVHIQASLNVDAVILEPSTPGKVDNSKPIPFKIPHLSLDPAQFHTNPAVMVKIDSKNHPNLQCKECRVTVQNGGEILLSLRNTGTSNLVIKDGGVIGKVVSMITSDCISTKLARTQGKKKMESSKANEKSFKHKKKNENETDHKAWLSKGVTKS